MTYKIYLQKQIWLPAAIDERKIEEKKKTADNCHASI